MRQQLPILLKRFSKISDPRNPKKIKYKLTVLMIYGILAFVFQCSSRREANREITRPMFEKNLRLLFPEIDTLPHSDTLFRLLSKIDVGQIEQAHINLINKLIEKKKFRRFLINNCYPIAMDGSQKIAFNELWDENLSQRKSGKKVEVDGEEEKKMQYFIYILEASLCFHNGMVLPLMSEFLEYDGEDESKKQDSEQKAFHRLIKRLREQFPRLPILLLLDGLYANGPVMAACRERNIDFMIVLKDGSLPTVWEEYHSLINHEDSNNRSSGKWRGRNQQFSWVNNIEYHYGNNGKHKIKVHTVVCEEQWECIDPDSGEIIKKASKHAWLSSRPLNRNNLHDRCNLGARYRWGIEAGFLVEKHQGYSYEHLFAKNWNAIKGYHYLMRLAHLINTLAHYSKELNKLFKEFGVRGAIRFIRETIANPWLDEQWVKQRLSEPYRLQLI